MIKTILGGLWCILGCIMIFHPDLDHTVGYILMTAGAILIFLPNKDWND